MKKRVIIPIAVISVIAVFAIIAAALNPIVYHKSFMLGSGKMSVVLCVKER